MSAAQPNTFGTDIPELSKTGTSKWPSGEHNADWMIRDGALIISIDFSGLTDEALSVLIERAQEALLARQNQVVAATTEKAE